MQSKKLYVEIPAGGECPPPEKQNYLRSVKVRGYSNDG